MAETLPYGAWRSPITSELIVGETLGLGDIRVDGDDIYWIEGRPGEGGRNVLVRRAQSTSISGGGSIDDITPPPFSVRTRVHEYGGGAMNVHRGFVYFTNFADQRLYQQAGGMEPTPLTPPPDPDRGGIGWRYADGLIDEHRRRWIGVREEHAEGRVDNTLVAIDLAKAKRLADDQFRGDRRAPGAIGQGFGHRLTSSRGALALHCLEAPLPHRGRGCPRRSRGRVRVLTP